MKSAIENSQVYDMAKIDSLNICGIILCAGVGARAKLGYNKILHYIGKKTILEMTIEKMQQSIVKSIYVVYSPCDEKAITEITKQYDNITLCYGGDTRFESVRRGLKKIGDCDIVVIHDGARPYVSADTINNSVISAANYGSGIAAVKAVDSIKEVKDGDIIRTLARENLYNIQTPQTFRYSEIASAYNSAQGVYNDDSEVYEKFGYTAKIIMGRYDNIKVTTINDMFYGAANKTKIGVGFDVHPLVENRQLILGGVNIPHYLGLDGHSDADALTHAIMDALLSAAALADIGVFFPDTDKQYKDISSLILLQKVMEQVREKGYCVSNISAVIMAQKPKMSGYIDSMRETLAKTIEIRREQIDISATTTEKLGIIGNEKGIAVSATCLLTY